MLEASEQFLCRRGRTVRRGPTVAMDKLRKESDDSVATTTLYLLWAAQRAHS